MWLLNQHILIALKNVQVGPSQDSDADSLGFVCIMKRGMLFEVH